MTGSTPFPSVLGCRLAIALPSLVGTRLHIVGLNPTAASESVCALRTYRQTTSAFRTNTPSGARRTRKQAAGTAVHPVGRRSLTVNCVIECLKAARRFRRCCPVLFCSTNGKTTFRGTSWEERNSSENTAENNNEINRKRLGLTHFSTCDDEFLLKACASRQEKPSFCYRNGAACNADIRDPRRIEMRRKKNVARSADLDTLAQVNAHVTRHGAPRATR